MGSQLLLINGLAHASTKEMRSVLEVVQWLHPSAQWPRGVSLDCMNPIEEGHPIHSLIRMSLDSDIWAWSKVDHPIGRDESDGYRVIGYLVFLQTGRYNDE